MTRISQNTESSVLFLCCTIYLTYVNFMNIMLYEPWYGNGDRMNVILNGEPLEEVDGFLSTWGRKWQPMEDVKGMWYTE